MFPHILRWLHNTIGDVPIPTHYFKILAKCHNASKPVTDCNKEIDTLAFIVPHNEEKMCSVSSFVVCLYQRYKLRRGWLFKTSLHSSDDFGCRFPCFLIECNFSSSLLLYFVTLFVFLILFKFHLLLVTCFRFILTFF